MALNELRVLLTGIGALLLTVGALVQAQEPQYGVVGEEVTLVPRYTGSPSEINWKLNGDKLVDMELSPLNKHFYRLRDRAKIDETNGRLTITNLNIGDTGLYKSEVLVNNIIQETNINLIVLERVTKPIITNRTIDETTIELNCKSASSNVKYEWRNKTKILSDQQSYNVSRSSEDVTLTCVVYNEASRINSTVIIPHIPGSGLSGGAIFGIIFVLILLFLLIFIILLICFPDHPWAKRIRECLPCLACCISKNKNGMQEQETVPLIVPPEESEICADVLLNVFSAGEVKSMELCKDDVMSVSAKLGLPETIESLCLDVEKVVDPEDYTATVKWANGETRVSTIKDPADIARLTSEGGGVKLVVKNAPNVKTIDLKKGDKTPYCLTVEGQRVQINNITLKPKSVTIKNLKPKDSGTYKVDIRSTDDSITSNMFTVKANQLPTESPDKRKMELTVEREVTPENGLPDGEPIGNITFHPINITDVTIAWKKDNEPVDTDHRIKVQQGELMIKDVTSEDAGSYTVHSEGQTLEQEFILRL